MGGVDQLLRDGNRGVDQVVGQQHHKGFVTDDGGGTQNGVAQSQRGGLAGIDAIYIRGQDVAHDFQQFDLVLGGQHGFQLGHAVEMIFDAALVASGNADQGGNAGGDGLFNGILDKRLVSDGQDFLGLGIGV